MEKKLTIRESFRLGKGWHLMIFAILAMLVTNAGVNDGLNVALPEIAKGAGLDYELCLSMGTVAGFVGVAMMLVIAKIRDRFGGRKVSAAPLYTKHSARPGWESFPPGRALYLRPISPNLRPAPSRADVHFAKRPSHSRRGPGAWRRRAAGRFADKSFECPAGG